MKADQVCGASAVNVRDVPDYCRCESLKYLVVVRGGVGKGKEERGKGVLPCMR
jgi:hypothetical protein